LCPDNMILSEADFSSLQHLQAVNTWFYNS